MQGKELSADVLNEIAKEDAAEARAVIKDRVREIAYTERVLAKMKKQFNELLERDVADIAADS